MFSRLTRESPQVLRFELQANQARKHKGQRTRETVESRSKAETTHVLKQRQTPISCLFPVSCQQQRHKGKNSPCKAKETSGVSFNLQNRMILFIGRSMILPASLVASVLIYLIRRILPTSLAQACDVGSPALIFLEGRVILLIKRSMALSHAFPLLPPSCLFGFKATAKERGKKPLFVFLLRSLLPADSKAHDPASLAASNLPMHTSRHRSKQRAQAPHTIRLWKFKMATTFVVKQSKCMKLIMTI